MKKSFCFLPILLLFFISGCVSEEGLQSFTTIGGIVYDVNTEKPLQGIRVRTIPASNEIVTDSAGYYCLKNLAPGKYTIIAEKSSSEYIFRQVKEINILNEALRDFDVYIALKFVFVDAKPELDHNFCISAYEFKEGEFSGVLTEHLDNYKVYPSSNFLPFFVDDEANVKYGSREPLKQIFDYCNKKSIEEGLTPCYSGSRCDLNADGYRLPTYDEWVYAAKGGKRSKGFIYSGSNNPDEVAWYRVNSKGNLRYKVAQKMPNELGLYDMSGNAEEICYISGDNLYDPSTIRYAGGSSSGSLDELSYNNAKIGNGSKISGIQFGCRLVRTIK